MLLWVFLCVCYVCICCLGLGFGVCVVVLFGCLLLLVRVLWFSCWLFGVFVLVFVRCGCLFAGLCFVLVCCFAVVLTLCDLVVWWWVLQLLGWVCFAGCFVLIVVV